MPVPNLRPGDIEKAAAFVVEVGKPDIHNRGGLGSVERVGKAELAGYILYAGAWTLDMVVPRVREQRLAEESGGIRVSPAHHSVVRVALWSVHVKEPIRGTGPCTSINAVVIHQVDVSAVGIPEEHLVLLGKLVIEPQR